jgi:hypothetical protein
MLDGFKQVISMAGAIVASLLILWIIGVVNKPGTHGMAAVGAGLVEIFKGIGSLLSLIHF